MGIRIRLHTVEDRFPVREEEDWLHHRLRAEVLARQYGPQRHSGERECSQNVHLVIYVIFLYTLYVTVISLFTVYVSRLFQPGRVATLVHTEELFVEEDEENGNHVGSTNMLLSQNGKAILSDI